MRGRIVVFILLGTSKNYPFGFRADLLVGMVEVLVESSKLEASRLFCLGSGVYAFYAVLG